jgi:hypothetical protein
MKKLKTEREKDAQERDWTAKHVEMRPKTPSEMKHPSSLDRLLSNRFDRCFCDPMAFGHFWNAV